MIILSMNTILLFFPNCLPIGTFSFLALLQFLGLVVMSVRNVKSGHNLPRFPF